MVIYFDHNASTPLNSEVLKKMMPYLQGVHANPSSLHQLGRLAKNALETARQQVADAVNCEVRQVVFTSGGTEANNTVLQAFKHQPLAVGAVEHASVLEPVAESQALLHAVDENGVYHLDIDSKVRFISLQLVNNETGVIQPIADMNKADEHLLLHTDASQAVGKLVVDFKALKVDFMTLSAHKFNGPKGVGALIIKNPDAFKPLLKGGFQEHGVRAGTENIAAIVGMGQAASMACEHLSLRRQKLAELRDYFEQQLKQFKGVTIFSESVNRVCNTSFFSVPFFHGETFLMECDRAGFALASGSACHSRVTTASHVLQAMSVDDDVALNAVRASFGSDNTKQQVDDFIQFVQMKLENLPASIKSAVGFQ